ncbi:MAG: M23 family metallopeptidase [Oscillospiraceae bacterium]|nr:M23 family metallopeptidase [Oscillospiraceae bacterium]
MWEKQDEEKKQEKKILFPAGAGIKKDEKGGNLMLVQTVCCAVLILLCLLFVNINAEFRDNMSRYTHWMLEEGTAITSQEEIVRFVSEVVEGIQKDYENFSASLEGLRGEQNGKGGYLPADEASASAMSVGQSYALSARLYIPLPDFVVSSPYGLRDNPVNGKPDLHTGMDMAAPLGTPVSAALPGIVVKSGYDAVRGNYLFIRHGGGVVTQYSHLQYRFARQGERVRRGEIVATVGSTGMATGPHLHFELKLDGKYVDPSAAVLIGDRT